MYISLTGKYSLQSLSLLLYAVRRFHLNSQRRTFDKETKCEVNFTRQLFLIFNLSKKLNDLKNYLLIKIFFSSLTNYHDKKFILTLYYITV